MADDDAQEENGGDLNKLVEMVSALSFCMLSTIVSPSYVAAAISSPHTSTSPPCSSRFAPASRSSKTCRCATSSSMRSWDGAQGDGV